MNDCISTCIIARLEPENAVLYALIVSCRYEHGNEDVRMLHGEGACEVEETRDESGGWRQAPLRRRGQHRDFPLKRTAASRHPATQHPPAESLTMSDATEQPKKERFAPKEPVTLNPPKDDVIDRAYLAKCDGTLPRTTHFLHARTWAVVY